MSSYHHLVSSSQRCTLTNRLEHRATPLASAKMSVWSAESGQAPPMEELCGQGNALAISHELLALLLAPSRG